MVQRGWGSNELNAQFEDRAARCGQMLDDWGEKTFGDIKQKLKKAKENLKILQEEEPNEENAERAQAIENEIDELLKQEEIYWGQRSRIMWLNDGDRNTSFFHKRAANRRRRNTIEKILNDERKMVDDEGEIADVLRKY